jgi:transcriptional regulator with XRE-family HTH domain
MGNHIRELREAQGMTQRELADLIDAPAEETIRRWERGAKPGAGYRRRLALALGVRVADLGLDKHARDRSASA